jgi:hypothetical protein
VREGRVELPRPFGHRILSPARLPFRHSRVESLTSVDGGGEGRKRVTHRTSVIVPATAYRLAVARQMVWRGFGSPWPVVWVRRHVSMSKA